MGPQWAAKKRNNCSVVMCLQAAGLTARQFVHSVVVRGNPKALQAALACDVVTRTARALVKRLYDRFAAAPGSGRLLSARKLRLAILSLHLRASSDSSKSMASLLGQASGGRIGSDALGRLHHHRRSRIREAPLRLQCGDPPYRQVSCPIVAVHADAPGASAGHAPDPSSGPSDTRKSTGPSGAFKRLRNWVFGGPLDKDKLKSLGLGAFISYGCGSCWLPCVCAVVQARTLVCITGRASSAQASCVSRFDDGLHAAPCVPRCKPSTRGEPACSALACNASALSYRHEANLWMTLALRVVHRHVQVREQCDVWHCRRHWLGIPCVCNRCDVSSCALARARPVLADVHNWDTRGFASLIDLCVVEQ